MRARRMTITALLVLLASAATLLSSAAPAAADFCLEDNFSNIAVGKGFLVPSKGVCREFHGFIQDTSTALFGQACGSSDNKRITFRLTLMGPFDVAGYLFTLDRASLSGSGQLCQSDVVGSPGACSTITDIAKIACSPSIVPVP